MLDIREEIVLGYGNTFADKDLGVIYEVLGIGDNGTLKASGTAIFWKLLEMLEVGWSKVVTGASFTTDTDECALAELGRLARVKYQGRTLVDVIKNWNNHFTSATRAGYLKQLWFVAGSDLGDFVGDFDVTKPTEQDNLIVGCFLVLFWLLEKFSWYIGTVSKTIYATGRYEKGVGDFVPFNMTIEESWPSVFSDNTNTINLYGITADLVDSHTLRGFILPWFKPADGTLKRLFSESKWIWRHGCWVKVIPLYSLHHPGSDMNDGNTYDKLYDDNYSWAPFASEDNVELNTLVTRVVQIFEKMDNKFWKKKAYVGKFKNYMTRKSFYDIGKEMNTNLADGTGGILQHQTTYMKENESSTDNFKTAFLIITNAKAGTNFEDSDRIQHTVLALRRSQTNPHVFQVIGDVPEDDYILRISLSMQGVVHISEDSSVTALSIKDEMKPTAAMYFAVRAHEEQNTDEALNTLIDVIGGLAAKGGLDGTEIGFIEWVDPAGNYPGAWTGLYGMSCCHDKGVFYHGRRADPYKKLKHMVITKTALDIDNVRRVRLQSFLEVKVIGDDVGQKDPDHIDVGEQKLPVSAKEESPKEKRKAHMEKMKEQQDAKKKKEEAKKKAVSAKEVDEVSAVEEEADNNFEKRMEAEE